jgi:hypothetical protein
VVLESTWRETRLVVVETGIIDQAGQRLTVRTPGYWTERLP